MPAPNPPRPAPAKVARRDQLTTARRRVPLAVLAAEAERTAEHLLATEEVRRAATVAAYVAVGHEPGTGLLLDRLRERGVRVLLPLVRPDRVLDWAPYTGPRSLAPARFGLLEPVTEPLGPDAIATADVVLVPALAVDAEGVRLGKGGGFYDRALARVPVGTFTCALLRSEEVGVDLPVEPHDRPVSAAATPDGVTRLPRTPRAT